jgi:hypothetical protein
MGRKPFDMWIKPIRIFGIKITGGNQKMICLLELEGIIKSKIKEVEAEKCYYDEDEQWNNGKVEGLELALELAKKINQK